MFRCGIKNIHQVKIYETETNWIDYKCTNLVNRTSFMYV